MVKKKVRKEIIKKVGKIKKQGARNKCKQVARICFKKYTKKVEMNRHKRYAREAESNRQEGMQERYK